MAWNPFYPDFPPTAGDEDNTYKYTIWLIPLDDQNTQLAFPTNPLEFFSEPGTNGEMSETVQMFLDAVHSTGRWDITVSRSVVNSQTMIPNGV